MRAVFAGAICVLAATGTTVAARDRSPDNSPFAAIYEWTGFYVGGNLGASFGRSTTDAVATGLPFATVTERMNGVVGGIQAGYNGRFDWLLFGFETDFQGTSQRGSSSLVSIIPGTPDIPAVPGTPGIPCIFIDGPNTPCKPGTGIPGTPGTPAIPGAPAVTGIIGYQNALPWFGTVRGRLGFTAMDRWWLYATAGLAYGDVTTTETLMVNGTFVGLKTDAIRFGWVVGGGVETFVWNGWTMKLEYLYIDFGNIGPATLSGIAPITTVSASSHVTDQIFRVGFNYHFAPGRP